MLLRLVVTLFLVAGAVFAGDCKLAVVTWQQPTRYTTVNSSQNPDDLVTQTETYGCISLGEKVVVVIHSLEGGKANGVIVIPLGSVTKIALLKSQDITPGSMPKLDPDSDNIETKKVKGHV